MKKLVSFLSKKTLVIALAALVFAGGAFVSAQANEVEPFVFGSGLQNRFGPILLTSNSNRSTDPVAEAEANGPYTDLRLMAEGIVDLNEIEVFGEANILGRAAFGTTILGSYSTSGITVGGNIMTTDLVDLDDSNPRPLCSNANGLVYVCPESENETYSWISGTWGSCSGVQAASCSGTYTQTSTSSTQGSCTGTYTTTTTPASCTGFYGFNDDPGFNCNGPCGQCTDYSCAGLSQSQCGNDPEGIGGLPGYYCGQNTCTWDPGVQEQVSCSGLSGTQCTSQEYSDCTWEPQTTTTTLQCSGPTTQNSCTSQSASCTWNQGSSGTQTRGVQCQDSQGNVVSDGLCSGQKPDETRACS